MPSSAGAGTVSPTSRWDPGRRPSSRVSSTSGALGSRLVKTNSHFWTQTQPEKRIRPRVRGQNGWVPGSAVALGETAYEPVVDRVGH